MFRKLENNRPFLKMAFEGFAGDGKSFTATQIAIGVHKLIGSSKPIAIFDTEKAFKALKPQFDTAGIEALCDDESRSLASLSAAIKQCEEGLADILIVDSITHVWENYLQAYMQQKNRTRLQFEDWGILKPKWKAEFSTPFVQAKCHIIFTGRAGFEYSDEKNEETGKREIFKSGIKMKAETETAFEPDILVLMQKKMDLIADKKKITREATIIKDRTDTIDGKTFENPSFNEFYPAIKALLDGTLKELHGKELPDTFNDWEGRFGEISRKRDQVIAEIEGCFNFMGLGTSGDHKKMKSAILNNVFQVLSVDKLSSMKVDVLEAGYGVIKDFANWYNDYLMQCEQETSAPDKSVIGEKLRSMIPDLKLVS